jgi:hypothetical protein
MACAGFTSRLRNHELNTVTKITRYIRKICHKQWILFTIITITSHYYVD